MFWFLFTKLAKKAAKKATEKEGEEKKEDEGMKIFQYIVDGSSLLYIFLALLLAVALIAIIAFLLTALASVIPGS